MMDPGFDLLPSLSGIVEPDEKYIGRKPRYQKGFVHKRGKATAKQWVLVAVERNAPMWSAPVHSDSIAKLSPVIEQFLDKRAHLMTDELHAYKLIGKKYASL